VLTCPLYVSIVILLDGRTLGEDMCRGILRGILEKVAQNADQRREDIWVELSQHEEQYKSVSTSPSPDDLV